jgi:hypothetical protein
MKTAPSPKNDWRLRIRPLKVELTPNGAPPVRKNRYDPQQLQSPGPLNKVIRIRVLRSFLIRVSVLNKTNRLKECVKQIEK